MDEANQTQQTNSINSDNKQKENAGASSPSPKKNKPTPESLAKLENLKNARAALLERHAVLKENKPLAIGICKQLAECEKDFSKKLLRTILHFHTRNVSYLKNVAKGGKRFNLDGTESSDIEQQAIDYSNDFLKTLYEKQAARKAKKQAQKNRKFAPKKPFVKKESEKAPISVTSKDDLRRKKLQMLAQKFGKKSLEKSEEKTNS